MRRATRPAAAHEPIAREVRTTGRITELAVKRSADDALVLYSFTPGTSLRDGTGLEWERRLLLYLLHRLYGFPVWRVGKGKD